MNKYTIFSGQIFGQWTVISFSHRNKHYQSFWYCRCSCGYESILDKLRLVNKDATKCKVCANALRRIHKPVQIGGKYGKWIVIKNDADKYYVIAQCECGTIKRRWKQSLQYGQSKQCHACAGRKTATSHGHNGRGRTSPEYRAWCNAKNRVFNRKVPNFDKYGGRGIAMFEPWVKSFETFLADVGLKPSPQHSLERINNDGNYEPGNVRWALPLEQVRNRSITFKVNNEYLDLRKLAKEIKVHPNTIKNLLFIGKFTLEEVNEFSKLSHYQKIKMGESINNNCPLTFTELEKIQSPVPPSPKRHPLWTTWHGIKQRCNNPKNKDFYNYGARGIKVCSEWSTFSGFYESIIKAIGNKPSPKHQLDRIDNNKDYKPSNVRWATLNDQAKNKQASVVLAGQKISASEICVRYRISRQAVIKLAALGWNEEGLKFFSKLTFREKKALRIFAAQLSQDETLHKHKTLYFSQK